MENELKQRNGCISFWLWVAIIVNIAMVVYYAVSMFSAWSSEAALGLGLCSIFGAVNVLSAILLLRWNKIGFYMMVCSSILAIVVNICVLKMPAVAMIGSLFGILIWWAILQIKKDGVSAWSQLQSGWDGKHCRHLYQMFVAIGVILFILTMIAFGNANGSNDDFEYEEVEVVEVGDDEIMTDEEVEEVIVDSATTVEDDIIVVEEPVKPEPQEQQNRKEESVRQTPAPKSDDSEDYDKHERFIKEAIREGNKSFPQKAAEGMIIKRCYLDGDYVMYLAECDEDLYDMELLNMSKGDMKQAIKDMIRRNTDPQISYFVKACIKAHKGFGVKYQGDTTGVSCIVKVPYSELKNL